MPGRARADPGCSIAPLLWGKITKVAPGPPRVTILPAGVMLSRRKRRPLNQSFSTDLTGGRPAVDAVTSYWMKPEVGAAALHPAPAAMASSAARRAARRQREASVAIFIR